MNSKNSSWGGNWTEQKLIAFEKYVKAYLTIMNNCRDTYKWKLIYFDGFAGSGDREVDQNTELYNEFFPENDFSENPYKGAAERVLRIEERGFNFYYFIDKNNEANSKLKEKLQHYEAKDKKLIFRTEDANDQIKRLAGALKDKKYKALVLLDPFGMQIEWSAIEQLKNTSCDLWILIPSGVIVNRLLDRQGKLTCIEKLTSFFGMSEAEIREVFYKKETEQSLFGEEEVTRKIDNPISKITELYLKKLHTLFPYVLDEPLVMYNTRNVPIYHFAFASNNKNALKIAKHITEGINYENN